MKKFINYKILGISLIFALFYGGLSEFWIRYVPMLFKLDYVSVLAIWLPVFGVVSFLINPIGILVIFYLLGRNYDLLKQIKGAIISIILGYIIGYYSIYIISLGISYYLFQSTIQGDIFGNIFLSILYASLLQTIQPFFVSFTGLALGYLWTRRTREHNQPDKLD